MINTISKIFDGGMKQITALGGSSFYAIITLYYLFNDLEIFFILLFAYAILMIISSLIKYFFFKERPKKRKYNNFIEKIDAGSFPSGHSARATALFIILSNGRDVFTASLFFLVAIAVMYSRIHLKDHRLFDILGGIILGILSSIFFL